MILRGKRSAFCPHGQSKSDENLLLGGAILHMAPDIRADTEKNLKRPLH